MKQGKRDPITLRPAIGNQIGRPLRAILDEPNLDGIAAEGHQRGIHPSGLFVCQRESAAFELPYEPRHVFRQVAHRDPSLTWTPPRREQDRSRSTERLPEAVELREVGVNPHSVDATGAERGEAVFALQPSERRLLRPGLGAAVPDHNQEWVEDAPLGAAAREWVGTLRLRRFPW